MNGLDIFSILTGIIGVSTVVVPLCQWLSPARRLRALDEAMRRVEHLLATMQQEGLVAYRTIDSVQEAHERLFRVRFTLVRLRFRVATARSIFHVVRLVFSGLPFEISRLRHHLEALHNQLQGEHDHHRLLRASSLRAPTSMIVNDGRAAQSHFDALEHHELVYRWV